MYCIYSKNEKLHILNYKKVVRNRNLKFAFLFPIAVQCQIR